jgi:hypothetical protein
MNSSQQTHIRSTRYLRRKFKVFAFRSVSLDRILVQWRKFPRSRHWTWEDPITLAMDLGLREYQRLLDKAENPDRVNFFAQKRHKWYQDEDTESEPEFEVDQDIFDILARIKVEPRVQVKVEQQ